VSSPAAVLRGAGGEGVFGGLGCCFVLRIEGAQAAVAFSRSGLFRQGRAGQLRRSAQGGGALYAGFVVSDPSGLVSRADA
jgi:hypothetical protein